MVVPARAGRDADLYPGGTGAFRKPADGRAAAQGPAAAAEPLAGGGVSVRTARAARGFRDALLRPSPIPGCAGVASAEEERLCSGR